MEDFENHKQAGLVMDNETRQPRPKTLQLPAVRPDAPVPSPATGRRHWLWGGGVAVVLALAVITYFQPWTNVPVLVATEVAQLAPVTRVLAVNGRLAALQSVDLRPQVSGRLTAVTVAEGDVVRAGDELGRIDPAAQLAILRQAIAGLDAALVAQAQARATLARTDALGANVSRAALDTATTVAQSAAQDVARTTALVDQARIQLANFTLRAPISGTVLALLVETGQSVDPSTQLLTIADLTGLVVETDVDEAYATQIRAGLPAALQLAGEASVRQGQVRFVSQRVDPATGGLAVQLEFTQAVTAPVGLTVTANIIVDQQDAAFTVPRAALVASDAGTRVFVVSDGMAQRRAVTVIDWPAARLVVTDGLAVGETVITDASGLVDGQAVRVDQP
jgi:RND family efflux transporter MFP subunit